MTKKKKKFNFFFLYLKIVLITIVDYFWFPYSKSLMCNYLVLIIKLNLTGDWGVLLLNGCVLVKYAMRHGINHKSWKGTLLKMNYQLPIFHIIYDYSPHFGLNLTHE